MELQLLRGDEVVYVRPVGTEARPPTGAWFVEKKRRAIRRGSAR